MSDEQSITVPTIGDIIKQIEAYLASLLKPKKTAKKGQCDHAVNCCKVACFAGQTYVAALKHCQEMEAENKPAPVEPCDPQC